jgi:hypothetical protein
MYKYLILSVSFFMVACGGGSSNSQNSSSPSQTSGYIDLKVPSYIVDNAFQPNSTIFENCSAPQACIVSAVAQNSSIAESSALNSVTTNVFLILRISLQSGSVMPWCSGTLIRTRVNQYTKPVGLTASHCFYKNLENFSDPNFSYRVVFNYKKPSCTSTQVSYMGNPSYRVYPKANIEPFKFSFFENGADIALLEFLDIPNGYNYFSGAEIDWIPLTNQDRLVNVAHPMGLDMRASYLNSNYNADVYSNQKVATVSATSTAVAGGSSGSGIFRYDYINNIFKIVGITSAVSSEAEVAGYVCEDNQKIFAGKISAVKYSLSQMVGY